MNTVEHTLPVAMPDDANGTSESHTARKSRFPFYLILCFAIPVILMYLVYVAMKIHPFGDGSVLVLDLNGQYVYFLEALRNTIYGEGSFLYSFFRALGGEFMGMYAYYLASPLSYLVALFPQEKILEALLTILLLKVGLCGVTFGFYLHRRSFFKNKPIIIAFSVMYALCAFAVVHQNNLMWTDAMIWLPLLVLGLEELAVNKRYKLYVISLAMILMSNYYIGYMVCIFSVLYFLYYYFSKNPTDINPNGERLHFLRTGTRFALFSILAAAIAGGILLAAYYSLTFGKNTFSNPNWLPTTNFSLLDFLTKFLPGSYDTVRPEGLPFVYCGLLTVLLVPIYFFSQKIRNREKFASLILLVVFLLSFWIRTLELLWHGFQRPNWLNHRYSFIFCFLLLILAYRGFGTIRKIGAKCLFGIGACLIFFTALCEKLTFETYLESEEKLLVYGTIWVTIFVTIILSIMLWLWIRSKKAVTTKVLSVTLCVVVCLEIGCSALVCVKQFDKDVMYSGYSSYTEYLQELRPIVQKVKEADDGFYRMEKLVHRKYNDNMALGIRGVTNSTSTLNASTLTFLNDMGYASRSHLSQYLGGNPVSDSLLGIRYLIDEATSDTLTHSYDWIASDEHYAAYRNPYALSVAYGVDDAITRFKSESHVTYFERLNAMTAAMLGEENCPLFVPVTEVVTSSTNCKISESLQDVTFSVDKEEHGAAFSFRITAPYSGEYYFFPQTEEPKEVILNVNGVRKGEYLNPNTIHMVPLGYFEKDETIRVTLTLREKELSILSEYPMFWYLDQQVFADTFSQLGSAPQFLIDENFTEDRLTGSIQTAKQNQLIQTTIPYDEGWKIYVDGQEIQGFETLDALLSFRIENTGAHTLELRYMPTIYVLGITLSLCGILIFLSLCTAEYVLKKKNLRIPPTSRPIVWQVDSLIPQDIPSADTAETNEIPKINPDHGGTE